MSIGLLLISILYDVSSYDTFHDKRGKIHRVISKRTEQNNIVVNLATTSIRAGKMIRETMPEVEDLVIVRHGFGGDLGIDGNTIPIFDGLWTEQSFLNIFSFKLLKGDLKTALQEPYSVVLTEETAKKICGEIDPIGKTISLTNNGYVKGNGLYVITGIVKDIPKFSHLQFEAFASFSTLEIIEKNNSEVWQGGNIWSNFVYVVLPDGKAISKFQAKLNILSNEENSQMQDNNVKISLRLQPLRKIVFGRNLENDF